MRLALPNLPLTLSQLDIVAVDSRRLGPSRLVAAVVVIGLAALTLGARRALIFGACLLVCEGWMWAITGPFARQAKGGFETISDGRRLAYMGSALCGCATWLMLSLFYWLDKGTGNAFLAQLIWSSLLLNGMSFAFRSNFALMMFTVPVAATMLVTPLLAPRFPGAHQLMAMVGLFILVAYVFISARRNVKAARELAEAQRDLERAKAAAESANAAKSVFLATMSHEIRTPLNGVLGMAQAMAREPLPPRQADRLDVIRHGGEILLALLNDILDLARIETGRMELEAGVVDLADLAHAAVAAFAPQAAEKGVALALDIEPEAEGLWCGDAVRLRQILFNLLSNALKFTTEGAVAMQVTVGHDGALDVEVADTGPGIPPERLATLFDRFVQGAASTNRRFGGSGLGLSIARELAELMGGSISVTSHLGEGSSFVVTLPLARAPAGAELSQADRQRATALLGADLVESDPVPAEAGALRVLAAEDNPMNRMVLKTLLEPFGAELTFAEDGAQAVEAWRAQASMGRPWDVILMDVQMPVMDGLAATRAIRDAEAAAGRRRTPIVALTANVMAHQQAAYRAAGMDAVVAKPIQIGDLVEVMGSVVG